MTILLRLKKLAGGCAAALLLASCGSSLGDPAPGTPPTADESASASPAGFIAFIQTLIATMTLETSEPRDIGGITPPVDDNADPGSI